MTPDRPAPHFTWSEVCGGSADHLAALERDPDAQRALVRVCAVAETIRDLVGASVRVTSGYRPGDPRQHGAGQALDIQVDGRTPRALLRIIRTAADLGSIRGLRQVIAESLHGTAADLDQPMGRGSGRWVHVAVMGVAGEAFTAPSTSGAWLLSWAPPGERRAYVWAS